MSYDDEEEVLDDDLLDTFGDEEGDIKFKEELDDEDPEDRFH